MSVSDVQPDRSSVRGRLRAALSGLPGYRPLRSFVYFVTVYAVWPPLYLLWVLPRTLYRLWRDVIAVRDDRSDPVLAYAYATPSYVLWYDRVARDIKTYGPNGYAYGDALGAAIGDRFFQHILSYGWLFGSLGPRRYALLSGTIFLVSLIAAGALLGQVGLGVVVALLAAGSAPFFMPLLHLSKPENFGWAFLPITLFFMLRGEVAPAAILLFILSITNITMVIPAAMMAGALWVGGALPIGDLILIGLPSAVKLGWQFLRFGLHGGFKQFAAVIGGAGKTQATLTSPEYLRYWRNVLPAHQIIIAAYLLLIAALSLSGAPAAALLAFSVPLVLQIVNFRLFRWADHQTFIRLYTAFALVFALFAPTWFYAIALIVFLYAFKPYLWIEAGAHQKDILPDWDRLDRYPHTSPVRLGKAGVDDVRSFFAVVPDNARILWEAVDPYTDNPAELRPFNNLAGWLLTPRGIELYPDDWLRGLQPTWYAARWATLRESLPMAEAAAICDDVGAQYVLAASDAFAQHLIDQGGALLGALSREVLTRTCLGEKAPDVTLRLIKMPVDTGLTEPPLTVRRQPNALSFHAEAGTTIFVKHNYHPGWQGAVNGQAVTITKAQRRHLTGMEIKVPAGGEVQLRFKAGWLL